MKLKYLGTNYKTYETLYGSLRFNRAIMRPETDEDMKRFKELVGKNRTTCHPMDALLGVEKLPFLISCDMLTEVVYDLLRDTEGYSVDMVMGKYKAARHVSQCERFVACAGEAVYRAGYNIDAVSSVSVNSTGRAEYGVRTGDDAPEGELPPDIRSAAKTVYIYTGQVYRHVYRTGQTSGKPERLPCRYGVVFTDEDAELLSDRTDNVRGVRVRHRDVVMALSDEDFKLFLKSTLQRTGSSRDHDSRDSAGYNKACAGEPDTEFVVIGEGHKWEREIGAELTGMRAERIEDDGDILPGRSLQGFLYILDRDRFDKRMGDYIRFLVRSPERAEVLISEIDRCLDNGDIDEILGRLRPYRYSLLPENLSDMYSLISENRDAINYSAFRARGIFPGTGIKDCSERKLYDVRKSMAGGVSTRETLKYTLALAALKESGRFGELVGILEGLDSE